MSPVVAGRYPDPGTASTWAEYQALLSTLGAWIDDRGSRLVTLDQDPALAARGEARHDVDLAFVVWQAVRLRRDELAAIFWPDHDVAQASVADVVGRPVLDGSGTPLAARLPDAVALVEALVTGVETALGTSERVAAATVAATGAIEADLAVAERLAAELGDQVRAVADLRRELTAVAAATHGPGGLPTGDPDIDGERDAAALQRLATAARQARTDLEALDHDRRDLLAACTRAQGELDRLRGREQEARAAAEACRDRIADPPRLAVPSVDAVPVPPPDLAQRPWAAARLEAAAFVDKVGRLDRAFDAVIEAYSAPRRERDDLRGLLQAYRDKADELGAAEEPELDAAYRAAKELLWSAPCDLAAARAATAAYQALVRGRTPAPEEVP